MHDEAALRIEVARGMQPLHEAAVAFDAGKGRLAHAGHDAHVGHYIGAVGDLHAATRERRVDRAHAVGNDIHRAAAHGAGEQRVDLRVGLRGRHPMIVGTGVLFFRRAHESEVFDARHVRGVRTMQVATRMLLAIQREQVPAGQHRLDEFGVLRVGAVAPVDGRGVREPGDVVDPSIQCFQ